MRPAVFLDLNGTLVEPVQVSSPFDYHQVPGAFVATQLLNDSGFVCPVITVQSRIEKGLFSERSFRAWFDEFRVEAQSEGAHIAGLYLCPHRSSSSCPCAKPRLTLYEQAARELDLDCGSSYLVGDTAADMQAAAAIGAASCLVLTGWGYRTMQNDASADFIGRDLMHAARWMSCRKTFI